MIETGPGFFERILQMLGTTIPDLLSSGPSQTAEALAKSSNACTSG